MGHNAGELTPDLLAGILGPVEVIVTALLSPRLEHNRVRSGRKPLRDQCVGDGGAPGPAKKERGAERMAPAGRSDDPRGAASG